MVDLLQTSPFIKVKFFRLFWSKVEFLIAKYKQYRMG